MLSLKDELPGKVAEVIARFSIAPRGSRIGVAVSAGADSVVLLHVLHRLSAELGISLKVIHVNHALRGRESAEDERFVRDLARKLNLEIEVVAASVADVAGNLEQAARDARRSAFRSLIESRWVDRVGLGHTLSDQAETVLFRLLRGTGLTGLAGMDWITNEGFVRPLLGQSRDEVREWAGAEGLEWREDSSNDDERFRRNFIRKTLLPQVRGSLNPAVETALARTAGAARVEEEYWGELIEGLFPDFGRISHHGLLCDLRRLNGLHLAVRRRLVRRAMAAVRGDLRSLDQMHVDAVLAICGSYEGHDRVQVPGADALRSYETLKLSVPGEGGGKRHYRLEVPMSQRVELPFNAGIMWLGDGNRALPETQNYDNFISVKDRSEIVNLNSEVFGGTAALSRLIVRNWEPGDRYQPKGHSRVKRIKELFQEGRVLLWERRHWPVLDLDGEIVWARGFGPAARFEPEQDASGAVSITYVAAP